MVFDQHCLGLSTGYKKSRSTESSEIKVGPNTRHCCLITLELKYGVRLVVDSGWAEHRLGDVLHYSAYTCMLFSSQIIDICSSSKKTMQGCPDGCEDVSECSVMLLLQFIFDHLITRVRQSQGIHRSSASIPVQKPFSVPSIPRIIKMRVSLNPASGLLLVQCGLSRTSRTSFSVFPYFLEGTRTSTLLKLLKSS